MSGVDGLGLLEHWCCPECGTIDGPHHENECTICWHDGDPDAPIPQVERLVPASHLEGAVDDATAAIMDALSWLPPDLAKRYMQEPSYQRWLARVTPGGGRP